MSKLTPFEFATKTAGKDGIISVKKWLIDLCGGDIHAAIILDQVIFWTKHTQDPEGWIAKSYSDWHEEVRLSKYQVNRAVKGDKRSKSGFSLKDLGIETKVARSNFYSGAAVVHYRIDKDKFNQSVESREVNNVNSPDVNNVDSLEVNNVNSPDVNNVDNVYIRDTEGTSEGSTEGTSTSDDVSPQKPSLSEDQKEAEAKVIEELKDEFFGVTFREAVLRAWKITPLKKGKGGIENIILPFLVGNVQKEGKWKDNQFEPDMLDAADIFGFKYHYEDSYEDLSVSQLRDPEKIRFHILAFLQSDKYTYYRNMALTWFAQKKAQNQKLDGSPRNPEPEPAKDIPMATPEQMKALEEKFNSVVEKIRGNVAS